MHIAHLQRRFTIELLDMSLMIMMIIDVVATSLQIYLLIYVSSHWSTHRYT